MLIYCSYKLVVVGGGAGGCATAAKFSSKLSQGSVAVIEPADVSLPLNVSCINCFYNEKRSFTKINVPSCSVVIVTFMRYY